MEIKLQVCKFVISLLFVRLFKMLILTVFQLCLYIFIFNYYLHMLLLLYVI